LLPSRKHYDKEIVTSKWNLDIKVVLTFSCILAILSFYVLELDVFATILVVTVSIRLWIGLEIVTFIRSWNPLPVTGLSELSCLGRQTVNWGPTGLKWTHDVWSIMNGIISTFCNQWTTKVFYHKLMRAIYLWLVELDTWVLCKITG